MMLCTETLEPPSCAAMLPQKFSAATTRNLRSVTAWRGLPLPQPPATRLEASRVEKRMRTVLSRICCTILASMELSQEFPTLLERSGVRVTSCRLEVLEELAREQDDATAQE